jgi:hypothetical protein
MIRWLPATVGGRLAAHTVNVRIGGKSNGELAR